MPRALATPSSSAPIAPGQRHLPSVRQKMSGPALRAFFKIAGDWELNVTEQRALLGWPAPSTFHKYKAGHIGTLPYDMLMRISAIMGIYKALHILYPDPQLAHRWIGLPNSNVLFGGNPALQLMTEGGLDGLLQVRRLLDARRG